MPLLLANTSRPSLPGWSISSALRSSSAVRRNTVTPSLIVSVTLLSAMVVGSTAVGSFERMAKSASLPGSRLPFVFSSKWW